MWPTSVDKSQRPNCIAQSVNVSGQREKGEERGGYFLSVLERAGNQTAIKFPLGLK